MTALREYNMTGKNFEIIIHAGFHKTGTTAIQAYLKKYKCENYKIFYDISLTSDSVKPEGDFFDRLESNIREAKNKGYDKYIISNERILGKFEDNYSDIFSNSQALLKIKEIFKSEFRLIIFLREQNSFLRSSYMQTVHQGGSESFQSYYDYFQSTPFMWSEIIGRATSKLSENISVHSYSENVVEVFFSLIPLEYKVLGGFKKIRNASYGKVAHTLALNFNKTNRDVNRRKWIRRKLQSRYSMESSSNYEIFLTKRVIDEYNSDNTTLFYNYGVELPKINYKDAVVSDELSTVDKELLSIMSDVMADMYSLEEKLKEYETNNRRNTIKLDKVMMRLDCLDGSILIRVSKKIGIVIRGLKGLF